MECYETVSNMVSAVPLTSIYWTRNNIRFLIHCNAGAQTLIGKVFGKENLIGKYSTMTTVPSLTRGFKQYLSSTPDAVMILDAMLASDRTSGFTTKEIQEFIVLDPSVNVRRLIIRMKTNGLLVKDTSNSRTSSGHTVWKIPDGLQEPLREYIDIIQTRRYE